MQSITNAKLKEKVAEFDQWLHQETKPFKDTSQQGKNDRLKSVWDNHHKFIALYMDHYIGLKPADMHHQIDNALLSKKHEVWAISGPREGGKTTRATTLRPYQFLTGKRRFGLFASESKQLAAAKLAFFVSELKHNARIATDFDIQFIKSTEDEIIVSVLARGKRHQFRILAISYKISPRGETFFQWRPDYMEIDDFESRLTSRNPAIGKEKVDMVKGEYFPAMSKDSAIVWFGNNSRSTSALNQFKVECEEDPKPDMHFLHFKALIETDKGYRSAWPAKWSVHDLRRMQKNMGNILFTAEMQGEPMELGNYAKPEWLENYYKDLPEGAVTVAWCDPSLGESGDYKVWVVVAYDGKRFYVENVWCQQTTVNAMVYAGYSLYGKHPIVAMRMEDNFWQRVLFDDFNKIAGQKGYHLPLGGEPNTISKDYRIESLMQELELGNIWFHEMLKKSADFKELRIQVLGWDEYKYDDAADALESACRLAKRIYLSRRSRQRNVKNAERHKRRNIKTSRN